MKHIKGINEAYISEDVVKHLINWKMVEDAKDMALEYIDEGYTLFMDIEAVCRVKPRPSTIHKIYRMKYNHDIYKIVFTGDLLTFKCSGEIQFIKYEFFLYTSKIISEYPNNNISRNVDFINRIKEAYPNERINI